MPVEKPARRKTPYEKKQDEYDRDRLPRKEFPKLFRRGKPRKKKGVNRRERRKVRILIRNEIGKETENLSVSLISKVAESIRAFPWKGASTVREIVTRKLAERGL